MSGLTPPSFPEVVQEFFSKRLIEQRGASVHTVASYRDTFRLLLGFAESRLGKKPIELTMADLDAPLILDFLDHLEGERGNSIRSRNTRLAAIHSFMDYASLKDPSAMASIGRVQAIPTKRTDHPLLGFLTREEIEAVIDAPDRSSFSGRRDHAMWMFLYNTGARVSEVISIRVRDLDLQRTCVYLRGKGRKERAIPLWKATRATLDKWKGEIAGVPEAPLFPNRVGRALTRAGVEDRLRQAVKRATERCPSLSDRRISPHTLRHTTAMHLLQSGNNITLIALWLGHEKLETTHHYIEADLAMKAKVLESLSEPSLVRPQNVLDDRLLAFLEAL